MNQNRKPAAIAAIVIILLVIGIIWYKSPSREEPATPPTTNGGEIVSVSVPVSETTKVSTNFSEYQNQELGFSVKYPTTWEKEETNSGVNFIVPIDKNQVSTVATIQANIQVIGNKCAFPPVTTVKDRGTLKVGTDTLNMISMSNTVQGRNYLNRMYSLQKGEVCYMFSLASITLPASSKNLTGSQATQAANNNKAILNTADTNFTDMVKTFAFVVSSQGQDETTVAPAKK